MAASVKERRDLGRATAYLYQHPKLATTVVVVPLPLLVLLRSPALFVGIVEVRPVRP